MPAYDYYCESNGLTVEAHHSMAASLSTWGDFCETEGHDAGETSPSASLQRVFSAPLMSMGSAPEASGSTGMESCQPNGCACCN